MSTRRERPRRARPRGQVERVERQVIVTRDDRRDGWGPVLAVTVTIVVLLLVVLVAWFADRSAEVVDELPSEVDVEVQDEPATG
ncbi:MAG TPA: hypothetical protein VHF25_11025 [Nitriliruptorales bacterium]|nr:hypothetical protein [Nitriliruptorales bacterium]